MAEACESGLPIARARQDRPPGLGDRSRHSPLRTGKPLLLIQRFDGHPRTERMGLLRGDEAGCEHECAQVRDFHACWLPCNLQRIFGYRNTYGNGTN